MPLICDFCSAPAPAWAYAATDAPLPNGSISIGSWCACEACAALIEAGRKAELAARSAETYSEKYGQPFDAAIFALLQEHCFWTHATGSRHPAAQEVN